MSGDLELPESWDYIVVGAGSSGCAVANNLCRSGRERVLLLEAGPSNRSPIIKIPSAAGYFSIKRYDWGYDSAPDPTRGGQSEHWIRGRVVGGSSSINGMNYVRGAAADFARWARLGNYGWGAEDVMSIFKRMEWCDPQSITNSNSLRGRNGPVHVRMITAPHAITEAFISAGQVAGYAFNDDYNGAVQEGVSYTQLTQRGYGRWSAADAFLKPVLHQHNLHLERGHAHRVLITQRRAVGVRYERGGSIREAHARHVVLCAGAINTPKLLMLSGIGDPAALSRHGIDTVLARKAVGQGLAEHPLVRLVYRVNVPTYNVATGIWQKCRMLARYLFERAGPLASGFEAMAFLRTSSAEREPDIQLHFLPFGYDIETSGTKPVVQMLPYPSFTILLNKSHPLSRGCVRLASSDPDAAPIIEPRLLSREEDVQTLVRGIKVVRRIVSAAPLSALVTQEVRPGNEVGSDTGLVAHVRGNTTLAYHAAGTCRMGVDPDAIVDPTLQVRGIENLWIADASIMPDLISGNTNAVCMMIGDKLGEALASGVAASNVSATNEFAVHQAGKEVVRKA